MQYTFQVLRELVIMGLHSTFLLSLSIIMIIQLKLNILIVSSCF